MNNVAARFLLGRGFGKVQELVSKFVRHGLTTVGGYLVGQGAITADESGQFQGAAVIVVGVLLSAARTFLADKVDAKN
jgi:hypothetical protein